MEYPAYSQADVDFMLFSFNLGGNVEDQKINSYDHLKPGDRVRITREFEVKSSNRWDGIRSHDGRVYRIKTSHDPLPGFEVVRIANPEPTGWPPQSHDVWTDSVGTHYHFIESDGYGGLIAYDGKGTRHLPQVIKGRKGLKLKYRADKKN